ncbi:NAD(P)H-binding protein [Gordonia sp. VNQ95]|jgi:uncharacterized protein YbjT (DUF2867 family)|uniref:NAD(P)H-binding protein n=1 Tax=Gordonia TaxID=2053 RepID=UPI0032B360B2
MRLLVTGATGYVGSRLVCTLLAAGHDVVVTSRNTDRLARFDWFDDVTAVSMDADDADSVSRALSRAGDLDAIYYLVHGIGRSDFADADRRAASHVAAAARDAGVGRIIYLGGFVPDGEKLSAHLRSRADAGEALRVDGGADLVWLRAAVIVGAGSTSFEIIRYVGDRLAVIPEPSWTRNPMDPISIRDVLHYLSAACDPGLPPGDYDIAGPDSCQYRSVLDAYLDSIRMPRVRFSVPFVGTRLVGKVAGVLVPIPSSLTEELITSLDHPMRAAEHRIRDLVPDPAGGLTPMRDAVRAAVSSPAPRSVCALRDPHHLATTDPSWAGGDVPRLRRRIAGAITSAAGTAGRLGRTLLPV